MEVFHVVASLEYLRTMMMIVTTRMVLVLNSGGTCADEPRSMMNWKIASVGIWRLCLYRIEGVA